MSKTQHHRLIIMGSGPAGYTAAIYAARANLKPALITGLETGGQLTKTSLVENWPGDVKGIMGAQLMERMHNHAVNFNCEIIFDAISQVDFSQQPLRLQGDGGEYSCDAVIIATGAAAKYLGLPSEQQFMGRGVSGCAVCDGFFYKNAKVAVVGGGNSAAEDALYLSKIAAEVAIIHRRDSLRAEAILAEQLKHTPNIHFYWHHEVETIQGDERGVNGIVVKNLVSQATRTLEVTGVFIAIGHKPNTDIFEGQLALENGYIVVKSGREGNSTATNIPGVFAAGDVIDSNYQQAITAAASGCMAALDAKKYLDKL